MEPFTFERRVEVSEADYVEVFGLLRPLASPLKALIGIAVGILCLLWPYTFALGVALMLFSATVPFAPRLLPVGARSTYRQSPHLHGPIVCSVSDTEISIHGSSFRCSSTWGNLSTWRESDNWLVLLSNGLPPIFFNKAELREAGVYDNVLQRAQRHGHRFGVSPSRRAQGAV